MLQAQLLEQNCIELRFYGAESDPFAIRTTIHLIEWRPAVQHVRSALPPLAALGAQSIEIRHQRSCAVAHCRIDDLALSGAARMHQCCKEAHRQIERAPA